jgi:hypothetical protein
VRQIVRRPVCICSLLADVGDAMRCYRQITLPLRPGPLHPTFDYLRYNRTVCVLLAARLRPRNQGD